MKKEVSQKVTYWLGVVAIGLIAGLGIQFVQAWSEPTAAPPAGNVDAPINIGNVDQTKSAGLGLTGDLIVGGSVGIGTNPGANRLEIVGGTTKTTGGLIIETRTDDPANPEDGRMWLRTDL